MNHTVRDIMTTHVVAVRKNASFKDMATRLREHRVSAFPVVDEDDKVVGVVSEADMLAKEALEYPVTGRVTGILHHKEQAKAAGTTAADLMSTPPVTVRPGDFVSHAARLMYSRKVKRLPVVDDDGRLVGIVTRSDVLSVYSRPDADIQHEITQDLLYGMHGCDPARFTVTVKDGIVTFEGTPDNPELGRDILSDARHVEGVIAVRDRFSYARLPAPRLPATFD